MWLNALGSSSGEEIPPLVVKNKWSRQTRESVPSLGAITRGGVLCDPVPDVSKDLQSASKEVNDAMTVSENGYVGVVIVINVWNG